MRLDVPMSRGEFRQVRRLARRGARVTDSGARWRLEEALDALSATAPHTEARRAAEQAVAAAWRAQSNPTAR